MYQNLKSLLENPNNIQNLLCNGAKYGLNFKNTVNTSNIINFGIIDKDKLDDDHDHIYVPSGYETIEETENKRKLYLNNMTLSFQESLNYNSNISIAKLINFQQFPSNVNNDVILSLIKDNDSNENEFLIYLYINLYE